MQVCHGKISMLTLHWTLRDSELAGTIEFENGFTATHLLHPATYLNKILVAGNEGSMQLWNIRTLFVNSLKLSAAVAHSQTVVGPVSIRFIQPDSVMELLKMSHAQSRRSYNLLQLMLWASVFRQARSQSMIFGLTSG